MGIQAQDRELGEVRTDRPDPSVRHRMVTPKETDRGPRMLPPSVGYESAHALKHLFMRPLYGNIAEILPSNKAARLGIVGMEPMAQFLPDGRGGEPCALSSEGRRVPRDTDQNGVHSR